MIVDSLRPTFMLSVVGERAAQLRLQQSLTQTELAKRAGVGVATVRRFEKHGSATMENVLRIAIALRAEVGFDHLFALPPYSSIDEALARPAPARRRRAPRRKR